MRRIEADFNRIDGLGRIRLSGTRLHDPDELEALAGSGAGEFLFVDGLDRVPGRLEKVDGEWLAVVDWQRQDEGASQQQPQWAFRDMVIGSELLMRLPTFKSGPAPSLGAVVMFKSPTGVVVRDPHGDGWFVSPRLRSSPVEGSAFPNEPQEPTLVVQAPLLHG